MKNEYRRLKFGLISADWRQPQVEMTEQILVSYLRTTRDFSLQTNVESTIEIFNFAKSYVGKSFKGWLIANFNSGLGARASLVRRIVAWGEGKVNSRSLISELRRDLSRLDYLRFDDTQMKIPYSFNSTEPKKGTVLNFDNVTDKQFFEILGILGPELVAHLLLSLNGIRMDQ